MYHPYSVRHFTPFLGEPASQIAKHVGSRITILIMQHAALQAGPAAKESDNQQASEAASRAPRQPAEQQGSEVASAIARQTAWQPGR